MAYAVVSVMTSTVVCLDYEKQQPPQHHVIRCHVQMEIRGIRSSGLSLTGV